MKLLSGRNTSFDAERVSTDRHEQHADCEHHIEDEADRSLRGISYTFDVVDVVPILPAPYNADAIRHTELLSKRPVDPYREPHFLQSLRTIRLLI